MNQVRHSLLLTEAVNQQLQQSNVPASLTIEQCASALAMSMTSFRRKLRQEETTFKLIHQKYLNELCVDELLTKRMSIDNLAMKLGYSERATFERAFRHKFGITPSKFRELSLLGIDNNNRASLSKIAQNMPPLPNSCQQLLAAKELNHLDIHSVNEIVAQDPVFTGRVMGLASKAIYGKSPRDTQEAISRNLGINTVINMAVIYAVHDALESQVNKKLLTQCTQAFLIAPRLFQRIRRSTKIKFDIHLTEQTLIFALLGSLLLCHKQAEQHEFMLHSLQGINNLHSLNHHINATMKITLYSASTLMLSLWHIDASVVKQLSQLDKLSQKRIKGTEQEEMILFMLSCLYLLATGHDDYHELTKKADLLNIDDFDDIKASVLNKEN